MAFSVIAAMDSKRGVGKGGVIPWRLKGDLEHFREITVGQGKNAVIMGRATWLSLPEKFRPLSGRVNVVLSRGPLELPAGVLHAGSLPEALELFAGQPIEEIFIIGGGQVYAEAIGHPACKKIYLTEVDGEFGCDTFFPEIPAMFQRASTLEPMSEGEFKYRFVTYEKA
ncbi:MAG: dihydrofolate reductase [Candidatus Veblenbacteria bacterium]|nr:dihydrofolate reductase [Candidatus Veblenbacteria bacterium]MDZ4229824.1 dihydrofolate reductase [Candidatus Veblenbacteria bacterium]